MTTNEKDTSDGGLHLRPELQELVRKIRALCTLTERTKFLTHHDIMLMLKPLSLEDKIAIGEALKK
jgi:hypothetical protein